MSSTAASQNLIHSDYGDDPDLAELVELFVDELPQRVAALQQALAAEDLEGVRRTAHQLKGAAGSYGFHQLTPYTAAIENSVRQATSLEEVRQALQELVDVASHVRAGVSA